MFQLPALLVSLAACTAADTGTSDTVTATDIGTSDTATTITSPLCDEPDVIDGTLTVVAGAFDWAGQMYAGAGSPDPEAVRVVGCVTETQMEVRILTSGGEAFWGPWSLTRTDTAIDYEFCD